MNDFIQAFHSGLLEGFIAGAVLASVAVSVLFRHMPPLGKPVADRPAMWDEIDLADREGR